MPGDFDVPDTTTAGGDAMSTLYHSEIKKSILIITFLPTVRKTPPMTRGLLFRPGSLLADTQKCPQTATLPEAEVLGAVTHRDCAPDGLTAADGCLDTPIDETIGASSPLHSLRDRSHIAAEPDRSDRNWTVNIFHSILS